MHCTRKIIKLGYNRARRNYLGGLNLDIAEGVPHPQVSDRPEEWISSLTPASNPGLPPIENEGLSYFIQNGEKTLLRDVISDDPDFYLGESYYGKKGIDLGFLVKILDSAMRLHVQAHPDKTFAREHLGSRYGKLECYYILSTGEKDEGYLRLGFQHLKSRDEWRRIIETQDMEAMDSVFEDIPVHTGEVWYIPGGMPHAIGKDITMIEIMEPSDLVVRCEFNREGITVPSEGRFMGKDLDFCLDIFDYTNYTAEEVRKKCMLEKKEYAPGSFILIDSSKTDSFTVRLHEIDGTTEIPSGLARAVLSISGDLAIKSGREAETLSRWQAAFLAAGTSGYQISGKGTLIEVQCTMS